ncbi:MAG: phosphatidylserine/phosphatidylglycerophosphate/cardiolipin synthase family protein [Methylotenera sp.]|nr:phosphatidylserine/phosphatidylglycerophosphate/cardiolipin synthase family protein [Oligoflexia bacterium]
MKFARTLSALASAFVLLLFSTQLVASAASEDRGNDELQGDYSLEQLDSYFAGVFSQSIRAQSASEGARALGLSNASFRADPTTRTLLVKQKLASTPHDRISIAQGLFELDVAKYNLAQGAPDFLSAKTNYYSRLAFDLRQQKHERPYFYLADWLSLNHPPLTELKLPLEQYAAFMGPLDRREIKSPYFSTEFQNDIDQSTGTELTRGNKVRALFNRDAIPQKVRLARQAHRYFFGAVMAIACDESTEEFVQAMIDKARSGVDVRLIMEGFYAHTLFRPCFNRLKKGGVDIVLVSDEVKLKSLGAFMHNKFWISDGREGIIGGENIIRYENLSDGVNQMNRDTDLLMKGPAVADLLDNFIDLWRKYRHRKNAGIDSYFAELQSLRAEQRGQGLRGRENYGAWLSNPSTRMGGVCRILVQRSRGTNYSIGEVYRKYLAGAQTGVMLTSPKVRYSRHGEFNSKKLSDWFYDSVRQAASRGVRIDLISNGLDGGDGELTSLFREKASIAEDQDRTGAARRWRKFLTRDAAKVAKANRSYLLGLESTPHVHTWTHFQYIHAKQLYFDRIAVAIGSVNLDMNSLNANHEAAAICLDQGLSEQMDRQLTQDLVNSVPVVSQNETFSQAQNDSSESENQDILDENDVSVEAFIAREAAPDVPEQDVRN